MTYQEAWKVILGALESTYEDNLKDAMFLLAEAAIKQDELKKWQKEAQDQMLE